MDASIHSLQTISLLFVLLLPGFYVRRPFLTHYVPVFLLGTLEVIQQTVLLTREPV